MKCKVGFSGALHITHNDSDGIGCGLITHYIEERNIEAPWCSTKVPFSKDQTEFMAIPTAIKTITSVIKTFLEIMDGKDIEDLDKDIIKKYVRVSKWYTPGYDFAMLPAVIYVSDLPVNEELIQLINKYLEYNSKTAIVDDTDKRLLWFDHHESTKKYIDPKYGISDWFIHSEKEYPGKNISAAKLMARYFEDRYLDVLRDPPTKAAMYVFDNLVVDISRYDTWEWRKKPRSYDDDECTEWRTQALISAYKNPYIVFDKIVECIDSGKMLSNYEEFLFVYYFRDIALESAIFGAKKTYRRVKLADIDPEKFADMDYNVALMIADSPYGSLVMESIYNNDPDIDIVISIYPTSKNISFRCNFNREDIHVNEIAERIGGGGHPAAAGANVSKETILHMFDLYYSTEPASKLANTHAE